MTPQEFRQELLFGLENLQKVKNNIDDFQTTGSTPQMRNSATTYACMGYFNALEHMMIRLLKFSGTTLPSGPASHQLILAEFQNAIAKISVPFDDIDSFKRLLGFRHVATKIYGFLIDDEKLAQVIATIQAHHDAFVQLFQNAMQKLAPIAP